MAENNGVGTLLPANHPFSITINPSLLSLDPYWEHHGTIPRCRALSLPIGVRARETVGPAESVFVRLPGGDLPNDIVLTFGDLQLRRDSI